MVEDAQVGTPAVRFARKAGAFSGRFRFVSFAAALAMVCATILVGYGLVKMTSGAPHFILLLPAIVFAGAFCGTAEGIAAALAGGVAFALCFKGKQILIAPSISDDQVEVVLYSIASLSVLWATHLLREARAGQTLIQARLTEVFRQLPGAAAILEAPNGTLLLRSDQSNDILGHAQAEVAKTDDMVKYHGIHADGRPYAACDYPISRALLKGEVIRAEPLLYRHPSGRLVNLEVYARPVRVKGQITAAVGMAFDVTERIRAEQIMRDSEDRLRALSERLRAALDAGGLGTWEIDFSRNSVHLDGQMAAMFNLPRDPVTMARDELAAYFEPEDRVAARATFEQARGQGTNYFAEMRGRTVDGAVRWYVIRGAFLGQSDKAVGVLQDVTEVRHRESALEDALRRRDLLMREADHRIKNSLQLVASLLRLQMRDLANADARAAITGAISRIGAIADAHVAFQESKTYQTIDVGEMIRETCLRLGSLDPSITLSVTIPDTIELVSDQAISLGLIVSEIVTNALRHAFAPGQGGTMTIVARHDDTDVTIEVVDDGCGMSSTNRCPGLGTTIIKTLCDKIGAETATWSAPGLGTRVSVKVPMPETTRADAETVEG